MKKAGADNQNRPMDVLCIFCNRLRQFRMSGIVMPASSAMQRQQDAVPECMAATFLMILPVLSFFLTIVKVIDFFADLKNLFLSYFSVLAEKR
ncbi:MAG TPA: hypothetical protein VN371_04855 [Chlorobaculum sp.]|nr:hypothetical protein [Chlorobaculum sp.]